MPKELAPDRNKILRLLFPGVPLFQVNATLLRLRRLMLSTTVPSVHLKLYVLRKKRIILKLPLQSLEVNIRL